MQTNEIIDGTVATRLREERGRTGLTQAEFAIRAGVSRASQANYESGKRSPDAAYLAAASKLGVDVGYVVTGVRKGEEYLLRLAVERLFLDVCDELRIPREAAETAIAAALTARRETTREKKGQEWSALRWDLLSLSQVFNAQTKTLELDSDVLQDIIEGLAARLHESGVKPSSRHLAQAVVRLYRICAERGVIDEEMLDAGVRQLEALS